FDVDPEFYRRHLSHNAQPREARTASNSPVYILPSFERSIFQFSITDVGRRDEHSTDSIQRLRERACESLDEYLHALQLGNGWRPADSVVRTFELLNRNTFSIEQQVTVYFRRDPRYNDRVVFVWLDSGRDVTQSPPGPWTSPSTSWAEFLPVVFYKPGIALNSHVVAQGEDSLSHPFDIPLASMPQSASLLSSRYDKLLDNQETSIDPFCTLHQLFVYFNVSEMQLMNAVAQELQHAVHTSPSPESEKSIRAQATFQHYRVFLQTHIRRIASILAVVNKQSAHDWLTATGEKSDEARQRLAPDLEYLLQSGIELERQCEREISIIMSNATIAETRSALRLTARAYRWAVLTAIYVPLSFTSSIFGMNFVQFSAASKGVWTWLIVTVPILGASLLLIMWNNKKAKEMVRKLRVKIG
ncbi:MAG: hypothetical protein Q9214_006177, partial [Letrouitia sp. 1 TL-2023]